MVDSAWSSTASAPVCQRGVSTTPTDARPPTQTRPPTERHNLRSVQDQRRQAPTGADGVLCTHNPKVAGSNPAPATTEALVDRKIGQGFYRFAGCSTGGFYRLSR